MNSLTINTTNTAYKNITVFIIAFLLFFFVHSPLNAATMTFDNGFESGDLSGFKDNVTEGGSFTVTTSPIKTGKYSGRLNLDYASGGSNYRAEAVLLNDKGNFDFETEYWFSFNFYYQNWNKDSLGEIAPFQMHNRYQNWATECAFGAAAKNAPFMMLSSNDEVRFVTFGNITRWKAPIQKQIWQNITVHFRVSSGSTGFIEAWKDGVKLFRVDGANSFKADNCGNPLLPPYFKFGVYKPDWKYKLGTATNRTLLVDNLKIAQGADGYSIVNSTPTTTPIIAKDTTPPAISNVQAAVTDNTATITWDTNEASDSAIKYGTTTSYGLNAGSSLAVTSHSVTLNNLTAGSLYNYRVSSKDSSGNTGSSANLTFTTNKAVNEGLVSYWPMDPGTGTTLPDLSDNGYNGTLVNGALLTSSGGVKFDGVNDYVNVGKFDVAGKAMTISAWVWADDLANCSSQDCRIISKATGTSDQDHYFMVSPVKVGKATRLRFRIKTNGTTSTLVAASGNLSNKVWFHVAAVYDGQAMRLYKDGVEVGSMAKSGSMTTNSNASVWIGGNPPSATARPWKGQIDDMSLYSYALTKEEIVELAK